MVESRKNKTTRKKISSKKKVEKSTKVETVGKKLSKEQDRQLFWFLVIIVVLFAAFLIPYFWAVNSKHFDYAGVEWFVEEDVGFNFYHTSLPAFSGANVIFNVYLRNDPRKNDVYTEGTFDRFKRGGLFSFSPEAGACTGDFGLSVVGLGAFLETAVGVGKMVRATSDFETALASNGTITYATCDMNLQRTLVVFEKGDSSAVIQSEENPYCYTVYIEDCDDMVAAEKFIVEVISKFKEKNE